MSRDLAIVLNSGGLTSAVVTALAAQKYRPVLLNVQASPQVGTRTRSAYDQQVAHFKPYREHTLTMEFLAGLDKLDPGISQGTDPRAVPAVAPRLLEMLPLIAVATRFAVHYQTAAIYLGLSVGSGGDELAQANEYMQIWSEMLQIPCAQTDLELITPLLDLDLWQVVDVGFQLGTPFEKTWSCIDEVAEPCAACDKCRARQMAFAQAGKPDPLRTPRKG